MQLKLQRSQRASLVTKTVLFCLDIRAEYSPDERANIARYKLGSEIIYSSASARRHLANSAAHVSRVASSSLRESTAGMAHGLASFALAKMNLNVSIASLGRGHHIECKDLQELLDTEDTLRTACLGLTRYLEVAATFDGSETIVEYVKGEERVQVAQNAPPLIAYQPPESPSLLPRPSSPDRSLGIAATWIAFEERVVALAEERGFYATVPQVRALCAAAALIAVVIVAYLI
jgi:hypothetical protein